MGLRYNVGLFLIATVVIIWVTSAEVTQVKILPISFHLSKIYSLFEVSLHMYVNLYFFLSFELWIIGLGKRVFCLCFFYY